MTAHTPSSIDRLRLMRTPSQTLVHPRLTPRRRQKGRMYPPPSPPYPKGGAAWKCRKIIAATNAAAASAVSKYADPSPGVSARSIYP